MHQPVGLQRSSDRSRCRQTVIPCCAPALQDAVRGEFREVAKLLSDNGGKVYEVGALRP